MEDNKNQQNTNDESKIHSSSDAKKYSGLVHLTAGKSINEILSNVQSSNDQDEKKDDQKKIKEEQKKQEQQKKDELEKELQEEIAFSDEEYIDEQDLDSMINPTSIEDSPEKKKRLEELQKKYNVSDISNKSTDGEYKRQFDFSQNLNVRKFKIKPPKKPIVIGILVGIGTLVIGFLLTFLIINRPQPPAYIASIELAQRTTESQYVGETVDLRGLKLKCNYSNGKVSYVPVTSNMITATSANISSDKVIEQYDPQTFVELSYENQKTKLYITVNTIYLDGINIEVFGPIAKGQVISYENILLTGHTSTGEIVKLDASKAEYKIDGQSISTETGVLIPASISSSVKIDVYHNQNGEQFSTSITINL